MFADDTLLYAQTSSTDEAQLVLQNDMDNLIKWFNNNKLHVNVSKSSCMYDLTTRHKAPNVSVSMNNTPLKVNNKA